MIELAKEGWGSLGDFALPTITALRDEARDRFVGREGIFSDSYDLDQNGTLHGTKRFSYAYPGPKLQSIHEKDVLHLIRSHLQRVDLQPTRASYLYYKSDEYNGLHTDVPQCEYTVLVCIDGEPQSLYLHPELIGLQGKTLLSFAQEGTIHPSNGKELSLATGTVVMIAGRIVPHYRPRTTTPITMAAMCYAGLRLSVWKK